MSSTTISGRNGREASVHSRYADAARAREASLCCPVRYSQELLKVIPQGILDRDYGCGDPTRYVRTGETVLDLGSGGGKVCDKTSNLLRQEPYAGHFDYVEPLATVPLDEAGRFDCSRPRHRHPRETKGQDYDATIESAGTCTDGGDCC